MTENGHLVMLIKNSGAKLIKILSKKSYKRITCMKRLKSERKYIKMIKKWLCLESKITGVFAEISKLSIIKL